MMLIEGQLAEERATKASLESRAVSVVTSSGTIVTLLFALGSLVSGKDAYQIPAPARWILVLALAGFLSGIVTAILVAKPAEYAEVTSQGLTEIATPNWFSASAAAGEVRIAEAYVGIIKVARAANQRRARMLARAIGAEVLAVSLVTVSVAMVLASG